MKSQRDSTVSRQCECESEKSPAGQQCTTAVIVPCCLRIAMTAVPSRVQVQPFWQLSQDLRMTGRERDGKTHTVLSDMAYRSITVTSPLCCNTLNKGRRDSWIQLSIQIFCIIRFDTIAAPELESHDKKH